MYFLILSHGIISFFYSKMFILFPHAVTTLFKTSLDTMYNGVVYFKIGTLLGILLSTLRIEIRKFLKISLYVVFIFNILVILRMYDLYSFNINNQNFFYLFRLFTGLAVNLIISLYAQFISRFSSTVQEHNKFTTILFNSSVFILPFWNFIYGFIEIYHIFTILNIIIFGNILYFIFILNKKKRVYLMENEKKSEKEVLYLDFINKDIWNKTYKVYLIYGGYIGIFLTFLMTILLFNEKIIYTYTDTERSFFTIFIENIPYICGLLIFLFRKYIVPNWLFSGIIFIGLVNFYYNIPMLVLFNTGLVYGLYLILTCVFIGKIKEATKNIFHYGSIIFYLIKTIVTGLAVKIFSKKLAFYLAISNTYYGIIIILLVAIFYIIYLRYMERKE